MNMVVSGVRCTFPPQDRGSGASMDGSVWRPIAPLGYGTIGDIWMPNYNKPATDSMYAIIDSAWCEDHWSMLYT